MNPSESYKCEICFMRKGTSTRKPRLNPQVVEQQQLIAQAILKEKDEDLRKKRPDKSFEKPGPNGASVKLKNFDRSSPLLFEIFANGYSVVITEFQLKSRVKPTSFPDSPAPSTCSSLQGFSGVPNASTDQLSPAESLCLPDTSHRAPAFGDCDSCDGIDSKPRSLSDPTGKSITDIKPPFLTPGLTSEVSASHHLYPASGSTCKANLSRSTSPQNSAVPSLAEVKREQAALKAEQAARDGDDEFENEEESRPYVGSRVCSSRRLGSSKRTRSSCSKSGRDLYSGCISETQVTGASVDPNSRLPIPNEAQPTTTRPRRQHPQINGPNPYASQSLPAKRRKLANGHNRLYQKDSSVNKNSHKAHHSVNVRSPESRWRGSSKGRSRKPRPIRVNRTKLVSDLKTHSNSAITATSLEPHTCHKKSRKTANKSELKCKIRLIHSGNHSSHSPPGSDPSASQPEFFIFQKLKAGAAELSGPSELALEARHQPLPVDADELNPTAQPRLSTESKNTSAMTDSSAASALEISH
ncbi:unnamed protein product [Dicrocoelium dendriticum]|nr:unnamed protein product [Dicrocoelium dendriticum]